MKLTKLVIHKYRNVAPGTRLDFSGQRNVLLGRNGTGKTTLLNLVAIIASSNFSQLKNEEFSIDYEIEASGGSVRIGLKNERSLDLPPVQQIGDKAGGQLQMQSPSPFVPNIRAEFAFSSGERLRVSLNGSALELDLGAAAGGIRQTTAPYAIFDGVVLVGLGGVVYQLLHGHELARKFLDQYIRSVEFGLMRFDESLGFLADIASQDIVVAFEMTGSVMTWQGRLKWIDLMLALRAAREKEVVDVGRGELPLLEKLVKLLGFENAQLRLERIEKKIQGSVEEIYFGNLRFNFTRADGSSVVHTLLSYGQKRLLSFYLYLESCRHVVVADELVNGLHHAWIEACLDAIGDRQAFLTSQNPLLVDYLGFDSVEQVRSSFIFCHSEVRGGRETLVWSNMTQDDAEGFFSAYQVGIQHVSEILRTRGLW